MEVFVSTVNIGDLIKFKYFSRPMLGICIKSHAGDGTHRRMVECTVLSPNGAVYELVGKLRYCTIISSLT